MARLYITEYVRFALDGRNQVIPAGEEPGVSQAVVIGENSVASNPTRSTTRLVRLVADEPCHIAVGEEPQADRNGMFLIADHPEFFGIGGAMRVAVIAGE